MNLLLPILSIFLLNTTIPGPADSLTSQKVINFRQSLEVMRDHITADLSRIETEMGSMNEGDKEVARSQMGPVIGSALSDVAQDSVTNQKVLDLVILSLGGKAVNADTADLLEKVNSGKIGQ